MVVLVTTGIWIHNVRHDGCAQFCLGDSIAPYYYIYLETNIVEMRKPWNNYPFRVKDTADMGAQDYKHMSWEGPSHNSPSYFIVYIPIYLFERSWQYVVATLWFQVYDVIQ